jgi:hypothetical protein
MNNPIHHERLMAYPSFIERFGVKTIVIHGVAIAASLFVSAASASQNESALTAPVDLNARPDIVSNVGDGHERHFKIVKFGEAGDPTLSGQVYAEAARKTEALQGLPHHFLKGSASVMSKGRFSLEHDVCLVNHVQDEATSRDGHYYLFSNDSPVLYNKQYVDFFTKSHEGTHCFFMIGFPQKYVNPQNFEQQHVQGDFYKRYENYVSSFREISGDLGVVLDYMRQTGTKDIYTDFIRPWRVSAVGVSNHRTAWALDIILKDIDSHDLQRKSAKEIPEIVGHLLDKHFMGKDGSYFPDALPIDGSKLSIDKPAAKALYDEILADMQMSKALPQVDTALVTRLKADIHDCVSRNISSYAKTGNPEAVGLAMNLYGLLVKDYGLAKLSFSLSTEPAKEPQKVSSFIDSYTR